MLISLFYFLFYLLRPKTNYENFHHFNWIIDENRTKSELFRSVSSTKVANFHDFCHNFNFHRWKFTPISNQRKGCSGDKKNGFCESWSQCIFSFSSIRCENSPCTTWLARDRRVKFSRRKSIKNKLRKFTRRIVRDRQRTTLANQSWVFCLAVSTIVTLWKFTQCVLMKFRREFSVTTFTLTPWVFDSQCVMVRTFTCEKGHVPVHRWKLPKCPNSRCESLRSMLWY